MKNRPLAFLIAFTCFVIAFMLLSAILTSCVIDDHNPHPTPTCPPRQTYIQHNQVRCFRVIPVFPTIERPK